MLNVFHAEKPDKLQEKLLEAARSRSDPIRDPAEANMAAALKMARLVKDTNAVEKIVKAQRTYARYRAARLFMAREAGRN